MRISDWSSDVCSSDLNGIHVEVTDRLADICQFATDADVDDEGPRRDKVPRVNQLFKGDLVGDVRDHATESLLVPSVRRGRQQQQLHVRVHFVSPVDGPQVAVGGGVVAPVEVGKAAGGEKVCQNG